MSWATRRRGRVILKQQVGDCSYRRHYQQATVNCGVYAAGSPLRDCKGAPKCPVKKLDNGQFETIGAMVFERRGLGGTGLVAAIAVQLGRNDETGICH